MYALFVSRNPRDTHTPRAMSFRPWMICGLGLSFLLNACETPAPRPNLPPSESDLVLLKPSTLCTSKSSFLKTHPASTLKTQDWGAGQEVVLPADRSASHSDESYFFDEDGTLIGTVFTFPSGLDLNPYPVLRHTLTPAEASIGVLSQRGEPVLKDEHGFQCPVRNRRRENNNTILGPRYA